MEPQTYLFIGGPWDGQWKETSSMNETVVVQPFRENLEQPSPPLVRYHKQVWKFQMTEQVRIYFVAEGLPMDSQFRLHTRIAVTSAGEHYCLVFQNHTGEYIAYQEEGRFVGIGSTPERAMQFLTAYLANGEFIREMDRMLDDQMTGAVMKYAEASKDYLEKLKKTLSNTPTGDSAKP